jgi:hypothetical protein
VDGKRTPLDDVPDFNDVHISWFLEHYYRMTRLCAAPPPPTEILLYAGRIGLIVDFCSFIDIMILIRESHAEMSSQNG